MRKESQSKTFPPNLLKKFYLSKKTASPSTSTSIETPNNTPPIGWYINGCGVIDKFTFGTDKTIRHNGKAAAFIQSNKANETRKAALEQWTLAEIYQGKRVRLKAFLKTEAVEGYSGIYMEAENKRGKMLVSDWMRSRVVKGTNDWRAYEIVLDVPKRTSTLIYGFFLRGSGKVWLDDVQVEVVDENVRLTNRYERKKPQMQEKPMNLGFEE